MMNCSFCKANLKFKFVSLGPSPLANSYIDVEHINKAELIYPLNVFVCEECFLVQTEEVESPENIFTDYDYFSSYSNTWLTHSKDYVENISILFGLDQSSQVVEVASNDGYLLQYFLEKGIPVIGVEPAKNVAEVAKNKGIPTEVLFFGEKTAKLLLSKGKGADLLIGNNVLAHVPDINDFVKGLKILLNPDGVITLEFPHLKHLVDKTLFDTIYHEHFSYFSFLTVERIFNAHNLTIFDVEEFPIHGGSLRIYVCHATKSARQPSDRVYKMRKLESDCGFDKIELYQGFEDKVQSIKRSFLSFLIEKKEIGKSIIGYGAPAKGNTFLNYCGIRSDFIDFTVDINPTKQGKYLPGSHILIETPKKILEEKPDYILILPWNIQDEIIEQLSFVREWDAKFVTAIPEITVL